MAIILMVRHGQNDLVGKRLAGRLKGIHLNQDGLAQARRLAAELEALPIKAVFSSPLERAQETANPIAMLHNLSVKILPELIEIDFGSWEGKGIKQLKRRKLWKTVHERPDTIRFPEGESFTEAQARVTAGLVRLSERYGEKDLVVCVAHSDVIRLAVAYFLGMPLNNFQRLRIDPASVTMLFLNEGKSFFGPINYSQDLTGFVT